MDKRHFTVVEKNGKEHEIYVFSIPSSAAKKQLANFALLIKAKK